VVLAVIEAATRVILLSGTPVLSKPAETFTQLKGLLPKARLTYKELADRFCVGDRYDSMKGCKNADELNMLMVPPPPPLAHPIARHCSCFLGSTAAQHDACCKPGGNKACATQKGTVHVPTSSQHRSEQAREWHLHAC
jgi:hypothetical protein